ncbi:carbohydrate kinase [Flavobacterium sp. DG1-102-2]|uniref:carbohydrate kinase family protein n=1 Tax=Flavobacterium sp. DG1-102-2 TaxID=3081663 RepID=UPI002949DF16|nr:carbohydrate kinase [Flavobacterium sp. DG1-102-2]MDV6166838.1 carbohydrate kinase [Flavobacterium sp. DG1-102-2]
MKKSLTAVCYGEVLWDIFSSEKKIGGAPLNVALRIKSLGFDSAMISCVGKDEDGHEIITHIAKQGLDTKAISTNAYPTGVVQVHLNETGSASYDIHYPSAWDKIEINNHAKTLVKNADVLIYGSLVCRDETSRATLLGLLEKEVCKVFDVNLRKPHYTIETLKLLMQKADFIKFNDEELPEIALALGAAEQGLKENIEFIAEATNTKSICVTCGKDGALLYWDGAYYSNPGYNITVADTVGAGDSFLASIVTKLFSENDPQAAVDFACAVGALVASKSGANPEVSSAEVISIMRV